MSIRHVYIDMDGVLCSFCQGVFSLFRVYDTVKAENSVVGRDALHTVINRKLPKFAHVTHDQVMDAVRDAGHQFWAGLPLNPNAYKLISVIEDSGVPYTLLTTHASGESAMGKVQWVRKYLPNLEKRITLTNQKQGCSKPGALLIDDYERNCEKWEAEGGTAILWPHAGNLDRSENLPIETILQRDI